MLVGQTPDQTLHEEGNERGQGSERSAHIQLLNQQQLREQKHWALENKRADELKDGPFLKCDAGFHQI